MIAKSHTPESPPLLIELATFGFLAILFLIIEIAPAGVDSPSALAVRIVIAGICYGTVRWIVGKLPQGLLRVSVHLVALMLLYSFLFTTAVALQACLVTEPRDELLISADRALFGSEASIWMQRFVTPALTEWMMFSYVIYIPALPVLAILCWKSAGERAAYEYLVNFVLVNVLCYVGFLLFPVATQMYHFPERYTAGLEGGLFTWCGEWVRANVHQRGGGLPSPHCAVATVMLVTVYRHWRRAFPYVLPIVLSLYVSTVYCRYHYLMDAVAGVLAGLVVLRWSPSLVALGEKLRASGMNQLPVVFRRPQHGETTEEEYQ